MLGRDLTSHLLYLEIAELYRDAAQYGKALQWAQNGLNALTGYKDSRLVAFAIEEYHRLEMHEEALNLVWKEFNASFRMEFYKKLERHALRAGAWPEWRKRALSEIRARIAKVKEQTAGLKRNLYDWEKTDHTFLIEIMLSENNQEAAWQEAQLGGCPDPLWLRLADLRAVQYPMDAAPVYLKQANLAIYGDMRNAVRLFEKAALTMQRSGQGPEFKAQMKRILAKHKTNRNFIAEVERNRHNLYLPD